MESPPAVRLIRRMGREDGAEVWEEFVRRYGWRIERQVSSVLIRAGIRPRREEVEELVQDVYYRLLEDRRRRLRRFRGKSEGQVLAFLNCTVRNVVLDSLRTARAVKRSSRLVGADEVAELLQRLTDGGPSPECRLLICEYWRELLHSCVNRVGCRTPKRDLCILRLALMEGLSSREIAAAAFRGLSTSTIDSVVYRARRRLSTAGVRLPAPGTMGDPVSSPACFRS